MNSEDIKEKERKAGHPLFIVIIFVGLLGFLFVIPEVYKKYNSDVAEFLGIGKDDEDDDKNNGNETENKLAVSAYYQIGSKSSLSFNEIDVTDVSLSEDKILTLTVNIKDANENSKPINLEDLNYYLEFYENKKTFVGRRTITGRIVATRTLEIDVSNLDVDTTTYFVLSHISDDAIGGTEAESDESGLSLLTCVNRDESYEYEFYMNKLTKTTYKYSYSNTNISEYADKLLDYQKTVKSYNELNGVTASIVENANTFIFISEFDYTNVSSFPKIEDSRVFVKNTYNHIIKFKMDAEGFDCK